VRLAPWVQRDGLAVLTRPRRMGLGAWLRRVMSPPKLRLDEPGTFVRLRLDGTTTVGAIVEEMRAEHGGEDLERRVGAFVRALRNEGLLAYPGWDDL